MVMIKTVDVTYMLKVRTKYGCDLNCWFYLLLKVRTKLGCDCD